MIFHLLRLKNVPIFKQLLLEEQLLRADTRNFCIINEGSTPAVVMGISGKPEELVDEAQALKLGFPLIKRFSGGGTVIVDENTLFVSLICNNREFSFPAYPEKIMQWTASLYKEMMNVPLFDLRENDFVIGDFKCGGNAQYIKKDRWIQHTSFLWDFSSENMKTLLHPRKTPKYREGRSHENFLCKLKDYIPTKEIFFDNLSKTLLREHELVTISRPEELSQEVRISTHILNPS